MAADTNVTVRATAEQLAAWTAKAGERPVAEWLCDLAELEQSATPLAWPVVVQLRVPVEFGSRTIATIEMRRGRLGDIKGMKLSGEMPTDQLILIASRLSGQPVQVIERLDMEDAGEVMAAAMGFYGSCLGGGRTR